MNIGFNAQLVDFSRTYRSAGVSNYIWRLLKGLNQIDRQNNYRIFVNTANARAIQNLLQSSHFHFQTTRLPTRNPIVRILWEQLCLPRNLAGLDILHCPVNVAPMLTTVPTVVTVHDLAFLVFKDKHLPTKRAYLRELTQRSCRRASRIITVSESTKQDVVRLLGVEEQRVSVVYIAPGEEFRWLGGTEEGRRQLEGYRRYQNLPEDFVLYVGTLEPRKNIPTLLSAYAGLVEQVEPDSSAPPLVIGGARGWLATDLPAMAKRLGIERHLHYVGYVPSDELPLLMNCATVFVYLSSYEGFGLPPLEAMACGVPVIVSNSSSLPEVVGEAGLCVDPHNVEEITQAIKSVLLSCEEQNRLRLAGIQRAACFSWPKTAETTVGVYRSAVL